MVKLIGSAFCERAPITLNLQGGFDAWAQPKIDRGGGGGSMVPVPFYKTCLYKLAVLVGRSVLENLKYEIY